MQKIENLEIERKFLVDEDKLANYSMAFNFGKKLRQGYISDDGNKSVRVRTDGKKGWMTVKSSIEDSFVSRNEVEMEIPLDKANAMLDLFCPSIISKKRVCLQLDGPHVWEIDIFEGDNEGLIVAEIELSSETENFHIPDFIGKEVTHDKKYLNSNIAKHPYNTWMADEETPVCRIKKGMWVSVESIDASNLEIVEVMDSAYIQTLDTYVAIFCRYGSDQMQILDLKDFLDEETGYVKKTTSSIS